MPGAISLLTDFYATALQVLSTVQSAYYAHLCAHSVNDTHPWSSNFALAHARTYPTELRGALLTCHACAHFTPPASSSSASCAHRSIAERACAQHIINIIHPYDHAGVRVCFCRYSSDLLATVVVGASKCMNFHPTRELASQVPPSNGNDISFRFGGGASLLTDLC